MIVSQLQKGDVIIGQDAATKLQYVSHATRRGSKLWQLNMKNVDTGSTVLTWLHPTDEITLITNDH